LIVKPYLDIGPWSLTVYTLSHAAGMLTAGALCLRELTRSGLSTRRALGTLALFLVCAQAGAHVYHVAVHPVPSPGEAHALFDFWNRGLALHGGLVGAGLAVFLAAALWKRSPWQLADIFAAPAALALFFFRLGCYSRGCCHGLPCGEDFFLAGWSVKLIHNVETSLHPTQLYAAAADLVLFALLWAGRRRKLFEGQAVIFFLLFYSTQRFCIGFLRASYLEAEARLSFLALPLARDQLFALAFFALGLLLLVMRRRALRDGLASRRLRRKSRRARGAAGRPDRT